MSENEEHHPTPLGRRLRVILAPSTPVTRLTSAGLRPRPLTSWPRHELQGHVSSIKVFCVIKVVCAPASSAPAERVFSVCGLLIET